MRLDEATFEAWVDRALDDLPEWVREHMENVAVVVAPWPTPGQRHTAGIKGDALLLGLYEGIPLTQRGRGYNLTPPDRITLFQGPLEMVARNPRDLLRLVRETVIHEIAHHFGFSEEEIRKLGY
jgi:predicted Zn-dependent protease with MMP-like domain